jgi:uncharacterized protein YbgA (DUF1722 family)/uncharacterized protein YbbK (DUF523 family)
MSEKIKLGISSCLLGFKVRYDGGHKLDRYIANTLGEYFEWLPICPEVECGLSTPRQTMRLVGDESNYRLLTHDGKTDYTDQMLAWGREKISTLQKAGLCGYIFKAKSPSSGMERVKIYGENNSVFHTGVGIWAKLFQEEFPLLPVEEEGRLHDPRIRENFLERVFILNRWRKLLEGEKSRGALVEFHTKHKLIFMSHSIDGYKKSGKLIADMSSQPLEKVYTNYEALLMETLKKHATVKLNTNVLLHVKGYFKKQLESFEKKELDKLIMGYKEGIYPLVVPMTLINHYAQKYEQAYLLDQFYLNPHPAELKLRLYT